MESRRTVGILSPYIQWCVSALKVQTRVGQIILLCLNTKYQSLLLSFSILLYLARQPFYWCEISHCCGILENFRHRFRDFLKKNWPNSNFQKGKQLKSPDMVQVSSQKYIWMMGFFLSDVVNSQIWLNLDLG